MGRARATHLCVRGILRPLLGVFLSSATYANTAISYFTDESADYMGDLALQKWLLLTPPPHTFLGLLLLRPINVFRDLVGDVNLNSTSAENA